MRMTASWLDPAIGSAEHKTWRALFVHHPGRLASDRLVFARSGETPPAGRAPSLPPCSGRSRSGLETLPHAERLERRPSLTDPCARRL
jgi:hypothetical protein